MSLALIVCGVAISGSYNIDFKSTRTEEVSCFLAAQPDGPPLDYSTMNTGAWCQCEVEVPRNS